MCPVWTRTAHTRTDRAHTRTLLPLCSIEFMRDVPCVDAALARSLLSKSNNSFRILMTLHCDVHTPHAAHLSRRVLPCAAVCCCVLPCALVYCCACWVCALAVCAVDVRWVHAVCVCVYQEFFTEHTYIHCPPHMSGLPCILGSAPHGTGPLPCHCGVHEGGTL